MAAFITELLIIIKIEQKTNIKLYFLNPTPYFLTVHWCTFLYDNKTLHVNPVSSEDKLFNVFEFDTIFQCVGL